MTSRIIDKKQDLLLNSISSFYLQEPNYISKLIQILNGEYASLRLIDWFVTNFAKKHNISYRVDSLNEVVKVYISYKSQLKSYSKKQFDPFNRTQRINFYYAPDQFITTTISQLNFFRWAIKYNVIDYIKENKNDIDNDMNASLNYVYNKKTDTKTERKKRKALSIAATKFLNKDDITILVKIT